MPRLDLHGRSSTGARASNAGDQYHFLWCVRKMLDMLHPRSRLLLITMEGTEEACDFGDGPEQYLSVDMAEYYGGTDLGAAESVVLSQFKYSYSSPGKAWTMPRLCRDRRGPGTSVIGRVAADWHRLTQDDPSRMHKLRLEIVSNQPLAEADARLLTAVRQHLAEAAAGAERELAQAAQGQEVRYAVELLREASGLDGIESLAAFLSALSTDGFGSGSLYDGLAEASQLVQKWASGSSLEGMHHLLAAARDAAIAGYESQITPLYVRSLLGLRDDNLNPASYHYEPTVNWVDTQSVKMLREAIARSTGGWVVLHGPAGAGKSTALSEFVNREAQGAVFYDFWAGGLHDGRKRWSSRVCLTQIINDLDAVWHTDVFANTNLGESHLKELLGEALRQSALRASRTGQKAIVVLDAVDNAVIAFQEANRTGESGELVLPHLLHQPIPEGVAVLVSCRTENLTELPHLPEHEAVHVTGFEEPETAAYVRQTLPHATDEDCRSIHSRTKGNPRVQSTLLPVAAGEDDPVGWIVANAHEALHKLYADLLARACAGWPETAAVVATVLEAVAPLSVDQLAATTGVDAPRLRQIAEALYFGLSVDRPDEAVTVRDQDFYEFARSTLGSERAAAVDALADYCISGAPSGTWARRHLVAHLFKAGRFAGVLDAVDTLPAIGLEDGAVGRLHLLDDLQRGLRACAQVDAYHGVVKILMMVAELQQTWDALATALLEYPSAAVYTDRWRWWLDELGNAGATDQAVNARLRLGRVLSDLRQDETTVATLIDEAKALHEALPVEERALTLDMCDCVAAIRARLDGLADAVEFIDRITDQEARGSLLLALGGHVVAQTSARALRVIQDASLDEATRLPLIVGALASSQLVPGAAVRRAVRDLGDVSSLGLEHATLVDLILAGLRSQVPLRVLTPLVEQLQVTKPTFVPTVGESYDQLLMRYAWAQVLRETVGMAPAPDTVAEEPAAQKDAEATRRAQEVADEISLQASAIKALILNCRNRPEEQVVRQAEECLSKWRAHASQRRYRYGHVDMSQSYLHAATNMIGALAASADAGLVSRIMALVPDLIYRTSDLLGILAALVQHGHDREAELFATAVLARLDRPDVDAHEAVSGLLRFAEATHLLDPKYAEDALLRASSRGAQISGNLRQETHLLAVLARRARIDSETDANETALQLGKLLAQIDQSSWESERIDFADAFAAVGALSPMVGLRVAVELDRMGIFDFESIAGPVATSLVADSRFPPSLWGVAYLAGNTSDAVLAITRSLERGPALPSTVRSHAVGRALWLAQGTGPLNSRPALTHQLVEWLREQRLTGADSEHAERWCQAAIGLTERTGNLSSWSSTVSDESVTGRLLAQLRADPDAAVMEAALLIRDRELDRWAGLQVLGALMIEAPSRLLPQLCSLLLEWDVDGAEYYRLLVVGRVLNERPTIAPTRKRELVDLAVGVMTEHIPALLAAAGDARGDGLRIVTAALHEEWSSHASRILEAVAQHIADCEACDIYWLASEFAAEVTGAEAYGLLQFAIGRWLKSEIELAVVTDAADDLPGATVRFLCDLLGHPRLRLQWRAAYSLVDMGLSAPEAVLPILLQMANERRHERWMAVQEWALFVVRCISLQEPSALTPHFSQIAAFAVNPSFPHVSIREHAKQALMAIDAAHPGTIPPDLAQSIELVNEPIGCLVEAQQDFSDARWADTPFDSTDTMPYLFEPLARRFGKRTSDVAEAAAAWFPTLGIDKYPPPEPDWLRQMAGEGGWQLTDVRHGTYPAIQPFENYYDRHLVRLVAGQWIDSLPAYCGGDHGYADWYDWFDGEATEADPSLTSRLLTAPPLAGDCWGNWGADLKDWLEDNPDDLLLSETHDELDDAGFVVAQYRHTSDDYRTLSMYLRSALIPDSTADACLRMLYDEHNPFACLPEFTCSYHVLLDDLEEAVADGVVDDHDDGADLPYRPEPWIVRVGTEFEYHPRDPYWAERGRGYPVLSLDTWSQMRLRRRPLTLEWQDPSGQTKARMHAWRGGRGPGGVECDGDRLLLDRSLLSSFLRDSCCCLLLGMEVRKYSSRGSRGTDHESHRNYIHFATLNCEGGMDGWTRPY